MATANAARERVRVLWCGNNRKGKSNGWQFPPAVRKHLIAYTAGKRVLHLFGGQSTWGMRLDIDRSTRPHVIGDAWLPPFQRDSFDIVILDPPYLKINQQMKTQLLQGASYVAREQVIWFHTIWIAADSKLKFREGWLVRVGDSCSVRCLQVFDCPTEKTKPRPRFTRGPAMRYNRWLDGQMALPNTRRGVDT